MYKSWSLQSAVVANRMSRLYPRVEDNGLHQPVVIRHRNFKFDNAERNETSSEVYMKIIAQHTDTRDDFR